jgi:Phage major capsid protein E
MTEFVYPTNAELTEIAQDLLPRLEADREIFNVMPIRNVENYLVMWEQEDSYVGLQQVRGLNGVPPRVSRVGVKRFQMEPGVYGEHIPLDEVELTIRRQIGTFATSIDVTDLVLRAQNQLLVRRLDRIESIGWVLLGTGTFSVAGPSGAILHSDQYNVQTFTALVSWGTSATATPLADLRSVQLLARGHSVRFDQSSKAYANQVTVNKLLSNTNNADIYGRRVAGLATANSLDAVNQLFTMDGLPNIVPYDEGYLNSSGTFVPHIPDNTVIVVGRRTDGAPIGEYQMVRNVNNPGMAPGPYMRVIDRGEQEIPRAFEVHDGHNGGPAIKFPSAVVRMNV